MPSLVATTRGWWTFKRCPHPQPPSWGFEIPFPIQRKQGLRRNGQLQVWGHLRGKLKYGPPKAFHIL